MIITCTAIVYRGKNNYIARNLDLEYRYDEQIVIVPRNYQLNFMLVPSCKHHYAIIGTATIIDDIPLYYDAVNEMGLGITSLNFVGNAVYGKEKIDGISIAPYEIIPFILASANSVDSAINILKEISIVDIPFNENTPNSQLHWLISDRNRSITVESTNEGLRIYDNPFDVLTNNPPFEYHINNMSNYINVTSKQPSNDFAEGISLSTYSKGMGGIGLPGDYSSASRFVKAAFVNKNSPTLKSEEEEVNHVFHILKSVEMPIGSININGEYEITQYSACCNLERGIYYYTTYNNSQISAVNINNENLDCENYKVYKMSYNSNIKYIN